MPLFCVLESDPDYIHVLLCNCWCLGHSLRLWWLSSSDVDLEKSPCPRGPIYKYLSLELKSCPCPCLWTTSPCPWATKSSKSVILQTVRYVWSREVHKIMSYLLMSDITYWYTSVSKPFFTVTQCCCPWGKSLFSTIKLQVLVLDLGLQVLVLFLSSSPKSLSLSSNLKSLTASLLSSTSKLKNVIKSVVVT